MRILIVEDDGRSADYLARGLKECGLVVDLAADGELGLALAREGIYDLMIVDRLLPGLDGIGLVKALRAGGMAIPVMMLSALATPAQRIEGLQAGCDDYLVKPYAFSEILARIEAIARRSRITPNNAMPNNTMPGDGLLHVDGLCLDVARRTANREGRSIALQRREVLLLQTLMRHAGHVVSRAMLMEAAWDYDFEPRGNIIDMHIHRIRKKIGEGFTVPLIKTVPGAGYVFGAFPEKVEPGPG